MSVSFKTLEYKLHESLVQVQEMLHSLDFNPALSELLESCKELIKTKRYNIAVMGEFKRGKSSLINALLGSKILPADVTPATATINRITYGSEPQATIVYKDGNIQQIDIMQLSDYVTKITKEGESRAASIQEAVVRFPTVICQNHIDIIDTPGLNDDEEMTRITLEMLNSIDAVIVTIHARSPFSETEKKFVCQLLASEQIHNIIFVVTFIDQLDEEDYDYDRFMAFLRKRINTEVFAELNKQAADETLLNKAHELLDNVHIFGVSAAQALNYFFTNNQESLRISRFENFSSELLKIVTAKQLENAVYKTVEGIRQVVASIEPEHKIQLSTLEQEMHLEQTAYEAWQKYEQRSKKFLDSVFVDSYEEIIQELNKISLLKGSFTEVFNCHLVAAPRNNESLRAAIIEASIANYRQTSEQQIKIQDALKDILSRDLNKIAAYREEHLLEICDRLKYPTSGLTAYQMMAQRIEEQLNEVQFSWIIPPIPEIGNLVDYNLQQHLFNVSEQGINAYVKSYKYALACLRKEWFSTISKEAQVLSGEVIPLFQEKIAGLKAQIYTRNKVYNSLHASAQTTLQETEELWESFDA